MKKKTLFFRQLYCTLFVLIGVQTAYSQNQVDSWTITSTPAPDQDTYTIGGNTYRYGLGDNIEISSVTYNGDTYTIPFPSQSYVFNRVDITPNADGTNVVGNRASIYYERSGPSNFDYDASLPGTPGNIDLEAILKLPVINRGALDVFKNRGTNGADEGPSNIERIDVIFPTLSIPNSADLDLNGFLASEKSGNNSYKAAAILSVDGSGKPLSYGNLVTIVANTSYGKPADNTYNPARANAFIEDSNSDNQPLRVGGGSERMGLTLITFSDLGISAGQAFYGLSFFGDDVVDSDNLLDPTTFPQNTTTGADIYGALGAFVTATGFDPLDDDNDGVSNTNDICNGFDDTADADNDSIPDGCDLDDDGDGIIDVLENSKTSNDSDTIQNSLDFDSDDDGISDADEYGIDVSAVDFTLDSDSDGIPDAMDATSGGIDTNANGVIDSFEPVDTDGDLVPDYLDLDSDNDAIYDTVEAGLGAHDNDNNGRFSSNATTDTDGNGMADVAESNTPTSTDSDGIPNYLDLDSDNDGIPDNIEAQTTTGYIAPNGDAGVANNGLDTAYPMGILPINTDLADNPDYLDLDSDNEGGDDTTEAGLTLNGNVGTNGLDSNSEDVDDYSDVNGSFDDTQADNFPDSDGDVLTTGDVDYRDAQNDDNDNDGIPDNIDLDDDNDGIPDTVEGTGDSDGDGIPDYLDLDSDNDGIPDIIEAGGTDTNGDGQIDYPTPGDPMSMNDTNNDGLDDGVAATPLPDTDSDNDGLVDRLDLDSDNDGIADIIEAGGTDMNGDGQVDYATPGDPTTMVDVDMDGFIDTIDTDDNTVAGVDDGGTALPDTDTDEDGLQNRLDLDSDNDGIHDVVESGGTDSDNNGTADDDDDNVNNVASNGIPTSAGGGNTPIDTGADASPDYLNLDSDADGCSDANEAYARANADGGDGGQFGTGTPAATGPFGLVTAAAYDTGVVPTVTDATDATACDVLDADGDGVLDDVDLDDDNDGIPDTVEGTGDSDGDGIPDYLDLDSDNDGIPDIIEAGGTDMDGDGQIDYPTPGDPMSMNDTNNDGLDDGVAATPLPDTDSDNDGLVDRLDLDSDNDGIADIIEAGGTDMNGDGQVDYATPGDPITMVDVDMDGFIDTIDTDDNTVAGVDDGGTALPDTDTDEDGLQNRLDLDSDNDGIHDVVESGGTDSDNNGTADDDDDNVNNVASNGIPTSAGGGNTPIDTGDDASPDYLNLDSDADGCSDANEAYASANADGADGGQFGTGTPAATGPFGLVTAAAYDTGVVPTVTDATDATACDILDADGDGVLDDQEITDGTDPNDPCDFVIANITETQAGAWLTADCDGDGVTNEQEVLDGTNPEDPCDFNTASVTLAQSGDYLIEDCDGDGVTNGTEITDETNPNDPCDFIEASMTLSTTGDWLTADCDGDTIPNGQEITDGTDPYDPCSSNGGTPPANANCDRAIDIESDLVNPGLNEGVFQINNIEFFPNNTVRIYNRWGVLVFETHGYDNNSKAFRGISNGRTTIQQDEKLPVGVYFYLIEYVDEGITNTIDGYLYVNR